MQTERRCLYCNDVLEPKSTRSDQIYCNYLCRNNYYYLTKYKGYYANRYQKRKKIWERSDNGKRAGIPIREWIKLFPEEYRGK